MVFERNEQSVGNEPADLSRARLQDEALEGMSRHRRARKNEPLDVDESGEYLVQRGDSLLSIARRSLIRKGGDATDSDRVMDEAALIARLNLDRYPEVWSNPHSIRTGMSLIVDEDDARVFNERHKAGKDVASSSDIEENCDSKPFRKTNGLAFAKECDPVEVTAGGRVVVEPGGRAIINRDATGFGFPGSHAVVRAGGKFIAAGGAVEAEPGARLIVADNSSLSTRD